MGDIIWIALIGFAIGVDAVLAFGNKIPNGVDTLSGRMRVWGTQIAAVPLFMGAMMGHFWLPRDDGSIFGSIASPLALVVVAILLSMFHVAIDGRRAGGWLQLTYVAVGVPLGHLLWSMQ